MEALNMKREADGEVVHNIIFSQGSHVVCLIGALIGARLLHIALLRPGTVKAAGFVTFNMPSWTCMATIFQVLKY
jgi:hypothetical protein